MSEDQAELLKRYSDDFRADYAASEAVRDAANEEFRFSMVAGGQWEGWLETHYADRSRLEFDQIFDHLCRTYGAWTEARQIPEFVASDDRASDDDAELLDGLIRRDLQRKGGYAALDTAVFEAMACGHGAIQLATVYVDDEDPDNEDQNVEFTEINNAYATVIWDAGARRADKSDAGHCTVLVPYSKAKFKEKWPDAVVAGLHPDDRRSLNRDTGADTIHVGVRYEIRERRQYLHTWANVVTGEVVRLTRQELKDEKAELEVAGFTEIRARLVNRREVLKSVFTSAELLEPPRRIAGRHIPVVSFYGYRAYIDGRESYHGVVRKRMDAQRVVNMSISLATETAAHSHEDKPIFTAEQVKPHRALWAQSAHRAPYLLAEPVTDDNGNPVHFGPVGHKPGATLAPAAQQLLQYSSEFIRAGTGGAPQDTLDTDASGKAINAVIKRVDQNVAMVFDNIKQGLKRCGEIYREIAAEVYADRAGRQVQIVTREGEAKRVELLAMRASPGGELQRANDPSRGAFDVIPSSGPNYQTQRAEALEALKDILRALAPDDPLRPMIVQMIIKGLPSAGLEPLKDYVHRQLLASGMVQPESDADKQFVQSLQQPTEPSPQDQYAIAAAERERTQAARDMAEVEHLQHRNQNLAADTAKKFAEARAKAMQGAPALRLVGR